MPGPRMVRQICRSIQQEAQDRAKRMRFWREMAAAGATSMAMDNRDESWAYTAIQMFGRCLPLVYGSRRVARMSELMSMQIQPTEVASLSSPAAVIVMGVSGCGKSTVGALLALRLRWEFDDVDWFHPGPNADKTHSRIPLTDEDHWPWLRAITARIDKTRRAGGHGVIACSALKCSYRNILIGD